MIRYRTITTFTAAWLCLGGILLSLGCDNSTSNPAATRKKAPHQVEAFSVTTKSLGITQVRSGTLRARKRARLHSQEAGRIEQLPVYEGDRVAAGDLLVQLDDRLLKAELAKAEANLHQAEIDLARFESLSKKNLVSQDEKVRALTDVEVAESEVRLLKTRLSYARILAPFDGIVTERLVEPGDAVPAYDHLVSLADPASLVTELNVSELLLSHLNKGNDVEVRIDALGDQLFSGTISRIHPTIDPMTRRGIIEILLDPVPAGAKAGQLCRVSITSAPQNKRVIPLQSLRRDSQGEYVFIIDNQQAQRRNIRSGSISNEWIEVLEGLSEDDKVVTRGFLGLTNGSTVTILKENDKTDG